MFLTHSTPTIESRPRSTKGRSSSIFASSRYSACASERLRKPRTSCAGDAAFCEAAFCEAAFCEAAFCEGVSCDAVSGDVSIDEEALAWAGVRFVASAAGIAAMGVAASSIGRREALGFGSRMPMIAGTAAGSGSAIAPGFPSTGAATNATGRVCGSICRSIRRSICVSACAGNSRPRPCACTYSSSASPLKMSKSMPSCSLEGYSAMCNAAVPSTTKGDAKRTSLSSTAAAVGETRLAQATAARAMSRSTDDGNCAPAPSAWPARNGSSVRNSDE